MEEIIPLTEQEYSRLYPETKNCIGVRYGKLVIESFAGYRKTIKNPQRRLMVNIKCDCGNRKIVLLPSIKSGLTNSCGCISLENISNLKRRHNLSDTPIHIAWLNMKQRCCNSTTKAYKNYGGRGIRVCDRWMSFDNFLSDMLDSYFKGATIDRVDVNGNYEPSNCRWITKSDQAWNKRNTVMVEVEGEIKNLKEWGNISGKKPNAIYQRVFGEKWDAKEAIFKPINPNYEIGRRNNR